MIMILFIFIEQNGFHMLYLLILMMNFKFHIVNLILNLKEWGWEVTWLIQVSQFISSHSRDIPTLGSTFCRIARMLGTCSLHALGILKSQVSDFKEKRDFFH